MIVMFGFDGWLAAGFESKVSPEGNMWYALSVRCYSTSHGKKRSYKQQPLPLALNVAESASPCKEKNASNYPPSIIFPFLPFFSRG